MLYLSMIYAAMQITASEPQQVQLYFFQAAEANSPVPLCDSGPRGGNCVCPVGYTLMQQQAAQSQFVQTLFCQPQQVQNMPIPRAAATEYPSLPRPESYGK